ncbi:MAG: hypothetical protein KY464_12850 [Gemmatimonadetes bacterium]|nr:hypothetical protein [Gemmatimonadota bacterium]
MTNLKKGVQQGSGRGAGITHPNSGDSEDDRGAEFGTSERGTRGSNRDADASGTSANQGHGHTREETDRSSGS